MLVVVAFQEAALGADGFGRLIENCFAQISALIALLSMFAAYWLFQWALLLFVASILGRRQCYQLKLLFVPPILIPAPFLVAVAYVRAREAASSEASARSQEWVTVATLSWEQWGVIAAALVSVGLYAMCFAKLMIAFGEELTAERHESAQQRRPLINGNSATPESVVSQIRGWQTWGTMFGSLMAFFLAYLCPEPLVLIGLIAVFGFVPFWWRVPAMLGAGSIAAVFQLGASRSGQAWSNELQTCVAAALLIVTTILCFRRWSGAVLWKSIGIVLLAFVMVSVVGKFGLPALMVWTMWCFVCGSLAVNFQNRFDFQIHWADRIGLKR